MASKYCAHYSRFEAWWGSWLEQDDLPPCADRQLSI
jgi:hypothetical protein